MQWGLTMEPVETKNTVIKCDGGGGPLGHPLIYLNLEKTGTVVCPYCSKVFVRETTSPLIIPELRKA